MAGDRVDRIDFGRTHYDSCAQDEYAAAAGVEGVRAEMEQVGLRVETILEARTMELHQDRETDPLLIVLTSSQTPAVALEMA